MLISIACYVLALDGLSVFDGVLMLLGLVAFLYWLIRTAMAEHKSDILTKEVEAEVPETMPNNKAWIFFVLGLLGLLISSKVLVWAAVNIAHAMGRQ